MKNSPFTRTFILRFVLILGAILALSSLGMSYSYSIGEPLYPDEELWGDPFRKVRGIKVLTAILAIVLQLIVSGLLIFKVRHKWVYIILLITAVFQLAFVVVVVSQENDLKWLFSRFYKWYVGWGYWLLVVASVLMLAGSILRLFLPMKKIRNQELLDENL